MFRYELQPVLQHREHLEEEAKRHLGEAQRRLGEILTATEKCHGQQRSLSDLWHTELQGGITPARQAQFSLWREELRRRLDRLAEHGQRQSAVVEQRRQALAAAHREMRKFELHRERELEAYVERQNMLERKFLDDLTIMRHGRADLTGMP